MGNDLTSAGLGPDSASVTRVTLDGEIDLARAEHVAAQLAAAEAGSPQVLEIDLSSVSFMDSQGLRLLILARNRALSGGRRVVILSPSRMVRRMFEISGVDHILEVVEERTEQPCPCCSGVLLSSDPAEDGLRPGDRYCPECRWVVVQEVLEGGEWPVACPTHGHTQSNSSRPLSR